MSASAVTAAVNQHPLLRDQSSRMSDADFDALFEFDESLHPSGDRLRVLAYHLAVKIGENDTPSAEFGAKRNFMHGIGGLVTTRS